jgi:hypothetical protein
MIPQTGVAPSPHKRHSLSVSVPLDRNDGPPLPPTSTAPSRPLRSRTFVARLNPSLAAHPASATRHGRPRFTPASVSTLPGSVCNGMWRTFTNLLLDVTNRYVDIMPQSKTLPPPCVLPPPACGAGGQESKLTSC